jgi:hypothetical protein
MKFIQSSAFNLKIIGISKIDFLNDGSVKHTINLSYPFELFFQIFTKCWEFTQEIKQILMLLMIKHFYCASFKYVLLVIFYNGLVEFSFFYILCSKPSIQL